MDRVVQLEDSIRLQHLVEEDRLAQRLLAIQAEGQARVQEAQRIADERATAQIESANRAAEERINSHAQQLQDSLSGEVSRIAQEAKASGGATLGLILESKDLEVKLGRRVSALEVASAGCSSCLHCTPCCIGSRSDSISEQAGAVGKQDVSLDGGA